MKIVILGDDPFTEAVTRTLVTDGGHEVLMSHPPLRNVPGSPDLEEALAVRDIEAALVGGSIEERGEYLRRAAGQGWNCLCLHPPGPNTDPYYQVVLSNHEFRAIVIPALPWRFHPAITEIRRLAGPEGAAGPIESVELQLTVPRTNHSLVLDPFSVWVDVVRVLIGEVENVAAMGMPGGSEPTERLTVQLRAARERRAEVTIRADVEDDAKVRMVVTARDAVVVWESSIASTQAGELTIRPRAFAEGSDDQRLIELPVWDRERVLIDRWDAASDRRSQANPGLIDGIRCMEVTEGAIRSLRRGRALDLHYEEVSEENNFKTVMTSVGCMMIVGILLGLPLILAGPALGLPFTLYLGYLIPLMLGGFAALQLLRFAIRRN